MGPIPLITLYRTLEGTLVALGYPETPTILKHAPMPRKVYLNPHLDDLYLNPKRIDNEQETRV